jgi:hypothetical protein
MFIKFSVAFLLGVSFVFCVYGGTEFLGDSDYSYTYLYEQTNQDWRAKNYEEWSEIIVIKSDDAQKYMDNQKERRRGIHLLAEIDVSERDGDTPLVLENIWGTTFPGFNSAKFGMKYNFD